MKIITQGHKYELENFEDKSAPGQTVQFIQKDIKGDSTNRDTTNLETICDGTGPPMKKCLQ